jgi:hypothetical protein
MGVTYERVERQRRDDSHMQVPHDMQAARSRDKCGKVKRHGGGERLPMPARVRWMGKAELARKACALWGYTGAARTSLRLMMRSGSPSCTRAHIEPGT